MTIETISGEKITTSSGTVLPIDESPKRVDCGLEVEKNDQSSGILNEESEFRQNR